MHLKTRLEKLFELLLISRRVQEPLATTIATDLVAYYMSKQKVEIKDDECLRMLEELEQAAVDALGGEVSLKSLLEFFN